MNRNSVHTTQQPGHSSDRPLPHDGPSVSDGRLIRRLLLLSWRYRTRSLQVFLLQLGFLSLTLGGLSFTGMAVDLVRHTLDPRAPEPHWLLGLAPPAHWSTLAILSAIGGAVVGMAALRSMLNYTYSYLVADLIHRQIVPNVRSEVFAKLQRLSFRFFDSQGAGAIINRVTRDVQMLRSFVDGVVIQGTILLLALGVFLVYMLSTHVALTLVSLALTPLLYVATYLFSRWAQPAYRENRRLADRMSKAMAEGFEGIAVAKVFGREPEQFENFQSKNTAYRQQQQKIFRNVSRFSPGVDLLSQLNIAVLLAYGGSLVADREITLGTLVVFAGLLQQFASRVSGMAGIVNTLQQSLTGARRVFEVLDTPLEVDNGPHPLQVERLRGEVDFDAVCFAYQPGFDALEGVSLHVAAGTCVGILGATGSGKSTLLSLLSRFYDPTSGCIRIDGIDLRNFDVDGLRRQIGIVFQETLLFRDTVASNIAFGHPGASRAQVEDAARKAGAHEFISQLPEGYDTRLEEGASNLSGGQRQRIAIARALLLEPALLLLDDPTTAIDAHTEVEVLHAVDSAILGRTTFLVSSRLSSLRKADVILVLEEGRVVERGTHAELLRAKGRYRKTAELQGLVPTDNYGAPLETAHAC